MSNYFSFKASSSPRVLLNVIKLFSATKLFSWLSDTNVHEADLEISFYLPKINYSARFQVLHLRMSDGNVSSIQELLNDDGHVIAASSTAFKFANKLLVTSVIEKTIVCDVNVPVWNVLPQPTLFSLLLILFLRFYAFNDYIFLCLCLYLYILFTE